MPFPGSSKPGIKPTLPVSPALADEFFTTALPGKPVNRASDCSSSSSWCQGARAWKSSVDPSGASSTVYLAVQGRKKEGGKGWRAKEKEEEGEREEGIE